MDLQKRIDFNQFIKEKINERILRRKILKSKLLKLNSMRNLIERLISNHHQSLYYMGLKLDDPAYDDKVKELNDSKKKEQAEFYRDQIIDLRKQRDNLLAEIKTTFMEYNKL
ncbi:hypothetical protein RDWZM_009084 [Blomia tropicalis]|uniref:Uncharacterized protein n=1 Tax=Blomia tropicalis TaxID=40697 RepID=A0A9Q0M2Y9_BLOTA|nr:hypothetical protein BLOT_011973 [Blomia tropicalis]KAJ6217927.1 hypothetical protein RDWZM_009084 [Blomia tropicalis]